MTPTVHHLRAVPPYTSSGVSSQRPRPARRLQCRRNGCSSASEPLLKSRRNDCSSAAGMSAQVPSEYALAEAGETKERRSQRPPHKHAVPSLTATAPNQVWTWDITKLATHAKGVFLHAYVIIDLFSRYVVGWMVAMKECKHLAAQLMNALRTAGADGT